MLKIRLLVKTFHRFIDRVNPYCRTTTVPYIEDDKPSTRFARDKKGKGIEVSSSMKYSEWQKVFGV